MSKKIRLSGDVQGVAEADLHDFTPESFFQTYINNREPVKLVNSRPLILGNLKLKASSLCDDLSYEGPLKVEKKVKNGFGNGNARIKMSLAELLTNFEQGNDQLYLTTQYESDEDEDNEGFDEDGVSIPDSDQSPREDLTDDDNNSDSFNPERESFSHTSRIQDFNDDTQSNASDDFDVNDLHDDYEDSDEEQESPLKLSQLFQPPLTNFSKNLPFRPKFFDTLVPEQVNLWMGYNKETSNDLSEVGVDNLGKQIPGNGSSSGLHHDHSDNLYVLFSGKKRFTLYSPKDAKKLHTVGTIFKIYKNGVIDYRIDANAPKWQHINEDGSIVDDIEAWRKANLIGEESAERSPGNEELDPPSFSKIPPLLLHLDELKDPQFAAELIKFGEEKFPGFLEIQKREVWLSPGDMLYLPAGWFHEVSSFPNEKINDNYDNIHLALNYWFAPPDNDCFNKPYKSDFWLQEFNSIIAACT